MRFRALMMAAATLAVAGMAACESDDDADLQFAASLEEGAEVPPVTTTTTATGSFSATIDDDNIMTYTLIYSGLSSNITMAHIHGPALAGVNAGILLDFAAGGRVLPIGVTSGTASGTVNLNTVVLTNAAVDGDSLKVLLMNGNSYVNVHTVNNGGGEIRGQLVRQ
jgi:hypothetical protein